MLSGRGVRAEQRQGYSQARNGVVPVPVYLTDGQPLSEQLAAAASRSAAEGVPIRALLITNPDNPTGRQPRLVQATAHVCRCWNCSVCVYMRPGAGKVYDPAALMEMLQWCCKHGLHYVRCVPQFNLSIGAGPHELVCGPLRTGATCARIGSLHHRRPGPLVSPVSGWCCAATRSTQTQSSARQTSRAPRSSRHRCLRHFRLPRPISAMSSSA